MVISYFLNYKLKLNYYFGFGLQKAIGRFYEEKLVLSDNKQSLAFSVLLDNVRDPGNFKLLEKILNKYVRFGYSF